SGSARENDLWSVRRGRRTQHAGARALPLVLCVALLLSWQEPLFAEWPMHRGNPQLNGRAPGAAPAKAELSWTFKAEKPVKAAAAIVKGQIYFGDDGGTIYALDLAGKPRWTFKTQGAIEATPLVVDGVVFIGSSDGNVYALEAASGKEKWKYETGDKVLGGANHAKNPKGEGTWILVGSYDSQLHCIDAATGKAVWTHQTDNYINGTPALLASGEIVFGGCDSYIHVLQLADGKEVRQIDSEAYIASSVAVADGIGYVGNYGNLVLAFDPKGGNTLWTYRERNFPYFSSAGLTEDRVIIGGRDKRLHCLDRATGKAVWHFQTRGQVDSSPLVFSDAVVVGSQDGRLYCVTIADGKERWAYEIGGPITASPAAAEGRIVVGAEDGNIFCFGGAK
ncbi:MAG: PQQ-binding-like beta-propeller repeat protein, partial [Verrucomicrobiota bacterium]|nr:PQQ-binding-like beta-propeller repeat protein [Verrucomicrobiota bacterium]